MENTFPIKIPTQHNINFDYNKYIQPINQNVYNLVDHALFNRISNWYSKRILDIGCNIGNLVITSNGKIKPYCYTGVDVQQFSLDIAKINLPEYNFVLCGDYNKVFNSSDNNNISLSDYVLTQEKYDVIICHGVFQHCDIFEIQKIKNIVKSCITDNGVFIFSYWSNKHLKMFVEFLNKKFNLNIEEKILNYTISDFGYLVNREKIIQNIEEIDAVNKLIWFECFYEKHVLQNLIGNFIIPDVGPTLHDIAIVYKNEIN